MVGVETWRGWEVAIEVEDSSAVTGSNHLLFTIYSLPASAIYYLPFTFFFDL
jgi:hypothetical protein